MSPVDAQIIALRAKADQLVRFYDELLDEGVAEHRELLETHPDTDPEDLVAMLVNKLVHSEMCRYGLSNFLGIAIDRLARQEVS